MTNGLPREGATSKGLSQFADDLELSLGRSAVVERCNDLVLRGVTVTPTRVDALAFGWVEFGDEIVLETMGGPGGRWELGSTDDDLALLTDVAQSVIAGRVVKVFGHRRSRVTVTLANGQKLVEQGAYPPGGCLPIPLWTKWGRKVRYAPYSADVSG